jgi:hypothetical protein
MQPNIQSILANCISEGLLRTLYSIDDVSYQKLAEIIDKASDEIWLQLDTYFTFTDNDND